MATGRTRDSSDSKPTARTCGTCSIGWLPNGYAIETEIDHIPTVVYDLDHRQPARELLDAFENTRVFTFVSAVHSEEAFQQAITSGRRGTGSRSANAA